MKLVHLVQDPGIRPGGSKGAAVHVASMTRAFERLGVEVCMLHAADEGSARAALDELDPSELDFVYERHALGASVGAEWALEHGLPHVLEVNAPLEDEARRWRPEALGQLDRARERAAFQGARLVLCVTRSVADYALRRGARPGATRVTPNGVDTELFRPRLDAERARAELFPELDAPFVVGFHGRLRPWHGFERVVQAVVRAVDQGVDAALYCVGHGPFEELLAGRLAASRWRVDGWCEQDVLARRVALFHALALGYGPDEPCYFSPLKLREAMAAGVVPVVPTQGELAAAVGHGEGGILYPPGEVEALSAALTRLAAEPAIRARLSGRARELAARCSWESIARAVLDDVLPARTSREAAR